MVRLVASKFSHFCGWFGEEPLWIFLSNRGYPYGYSYHELPRSVAKCHTDSWTRTLDPTIWPVQHAVHADSLQSSSLWFHCKTKRDHWPSVQSPSNIYCLHIAGFYQRLGSNHEARETSSISLPFSTHSVLAKQQLSCGSFCGYPDLEIWHNDVLIRYELGSILISLTTALRHQACGEPTICNLPSHPRSPGLFHCLGDRYALVDTPHLHLVIVAAGYWLCLGLTIGSSPWHIVYHGETWVTFIATSDSIK